MGFFDLHGEFDLCMSAVRYFRNLSSSFCSYLQMTNVSSKYLNHLVGFKCADSIVQILRFSINKLASIGDSGEPIGASSIGLYRYSRHMKNVFITQCLFTVMTYPNVSSIGILVKRNNISKIILSLRVKFSLF